MLVKIVDDDLGIAVPLQFDHHACVFVGLIANRADIGEHLAVYEIGNAFNQGGPVHVVRNFGDNDLLAATLDFFHAGLAPNLHAAATCLEILPNAAHAADGAAGREIRAFYVLHQLIERDFRIVDLRTDAVDHFNEIVRRHVGGHTDSDAGAAIDQQI